MKYADLVLLLQKKIPDLSKEEKALHRKVTSELLPQLQKGIPMEKRTWADPKLATTSGVWMTGTMKQRTITCNGEMMFMGKPRAPLFADKAPGEVRQRLPATINSCLRGDFRQVYPHTFQVKNMGGLELVWLSDESQELLVAIQAKYFDYIMERFATCTWWGLAPNAVVQSRVRNKGIKNVVALTMPYDPMGSMEPPLREDWLNAEGAAIPSETGAAVSR